MALSQSMRTNDICYKEYKLPRMRTLDECYRELKELDQNTSLSKYALRSMALSGVIPCVMCGNRRLINLDALIEYLARGNV